MKETTNRDYAAPRIRTTEIAVEQGIAASADVNSVNMGNNSFTTDAETEL